MTAKRTSVRYSAPQMVSSDTNDQRGRKAAKIQVQTKHADLEKLDYTLIQFVKKQSEIIVSLYKNYLIGKNRVEIVKSLLAAKSSAKLEASLIYNFKDSQGDKIRWKFVSDRINHIVFSKNDVFSFIVKIISNNIPEKLQSIETRFRLLEAYAVENAGRGVADFAKILFPELSQEPENPIVGNAAKYHLEIGNKLDILNNSLPDTAPEKWNEDIFGAIGPAQFILNVYGPWMGRGLTLAHIRKLDRSLYDKFNGWKRTHALPPNFDLPTKSEYHDRTLLALESGEQPVNRIISGGELQQIGKLAAAKSYREGKTSK